MGEIATISETDTADGSVSRATARLLALVPAGLALILYTITCSPTVNFTDSGELITVAWTGGVAHPPGYPLYTTIGSLFIHLPLGNPAWRMNMLSALFAALAVGLFYWLITDTLAGMPAFLRGQEPRPAAPVRPPPPSSGQAARPPPAPATPRRDRPAPRPASGSPARATAASPAPKEPTPRPVRPAPAAAPVSWAAVAGGLAGAGLLAGSVTFWNWATQAKFYTLHFAFVAGLLLLALRAHRALATELAAEAAPAPIWPPRRWSPAVRLLHLLAFFTGLSLTNHFLTFLLLPGLGLLLLLPLQYTSLVLRRIVRYVGTLLLVGILPLLLYLLLPIRANLQPLIAWGTPTTWGDFWRQVTAQSYQGLFSTANLGNHITDAFTYTANQFTLGLGILLLVPLIAGLVYLWRTDGGLLAASALIAFVAVVVALNYNIREIATYYVPFYMIMLWWVGLGVAQGLLWARALFPAAADLLRQPATALFAGALLPLIAVVINAGAAGHANNATAELYVRNAFKNFSPNALVLTNYWDFTSTSFYYQHVLDERPDVVIIDKSLLRQPFYLDYLERNYPDVVSKNAEPFTAYKALLRQWIDTGQTPRLLPAAYTAVLNGFIDTNLGQRPVYTTFVVPKSDLQEQQEVNDVLGTRRNDLVPEGFGYRIAGPGDDRATQDPQFDLRGVATERVPLDEIEASVVALYPGFVQAVGAYLANSTDPAAQQVGNGLLAQAAALQPLAALQDERPRLR